MPHNAMENDIIAELKDVINLGNLAYLKEKWHELQYETEFEKPVAWDYVFQKVYLHACLKRQEHIVNWLKELFELLDPVAKIALRQMFPYGNILLNRQ